MVARSLDLAPGCRSLTGSRGNKTAGKFEIYKGSLGEFRFHLKAANGQVIASSEGYTSKAGAENGIKLVQTTAPGATVVDKSGIAASSSPGSAAVRQALTACWIYRYARQVPLGPEAMRWRRISRSAKVTPVKFRLHLKAPNGEIIAANQGYESKASAEKGIEAIKTHAPSAAVEDHSR